MEYFGYTRLTDTMEDLEKNHKQYMKDSTMMSDFAFATLSKISRGKMMRTL